jgi:hypothetical protein
VAGIDEHGGRQVPELAGVTVLDDDAPWLNGPNEGAFDQLHSSLLEASCSPTTKSGVTSVTDAPMPASNSAAPTPIGPPMTSNTTAGVGGGSSSARCARSTSAAERTVANSATL